MKSLSFQVNGIQMSATIYGQSQPIRQTLVLLHGFTGSAANWASLTPRLEKDGRRIIALDLPGHGQSESPVDVERYSIEHCQADILTLLGMLEVDRGEATLLGYSMGGRIALYTAFSGFFQGLILESASPGLSDPAERTQRRQSDNTLAWRIENEGLTAFVDYWEQIPLFASQRTLSAETRASLRAQRLNNSERGLANSLRGIGTGSQPPLHDRLSQLDLPVLLLAGELDSKYCQIARQMALKLPLASLQIVEQAGHTIHLEQPDTFARLVDQFCCSIF